MSDELKVRVERRLSATPDRVFAAFSDPELIPRWLTPSPEISVSVVQHDFRVGGSYRLAYHLPDGSNVIVGGVYREISPPSRLVFTWIIEPPDEHAGVASEVVVSIAPSGDGAHLIIEHLGWPQRVASERHRGGWTGALVQLDRVFES